MEQRNGDATNGNLETELPLIKTSVRNLVEFILSSGDIDNRIGASARADAMAEGSRMHRKIQKRMGASYHAEVPLNIKVKKEQYTLLIEGRADGIIEEEKVTIDEIKGVYTNLEYLTEPIGVHKAQAMCYAYMYAGSKEMTEIGVQMTYCNLETEEICRFYDEFMVSELKDWFYNLIGRYEKWMDFQVEWSRKMRQSIGGLSFPFAYRKGQKELIRDVYRTILRKKNVFIQAPTGTGKTLSTIYPAIKAVGEGLLDKIFYLTAKTVTKTVAKEAFSLFVAQGYQAKVILITAKEKMCLCEEMDCNPVHCVYAKGHYDRVNDAVFDLLQKEHIYTREVLLEQARQFMVCPFELCLDVAVWSDDIVCDYNYVFDPNVQLKRFFAEGPKGEYVFLVDEAHNLVERGRKMYSAEIYKEDLLAVRNKIKSRDMRLWQELSRCNRIFLECKRECDVRHVFSNDVSHLAFALMQLYERLDFFLQNQSDFPEKKEVTEFFLTLRHFLTIYERVDERYVIYSEHDADGKFKVRLFCVDPSHNLQECLNKGRTTVFFSATLLPVQYYKELLSEESENYAVYAQTSFEKDQKLLLIGKDVSSRYTRRNTEEFQKIADYVAGITSAKKGNYMVFFPSYQFMEQVFEHFLKIEMSGIRMLKQESGMREEDREEFLRAFESFGTEPALAFCVLGGIFGEGIDLKEERLIGVIVVGTGLPQIGNEREILKEYYEKKTGNGFDYAYRYPGMNKVLQAAGRVIRTSKDRGIIALLDERFLEGSYLRLFPREWEEYRICTRKDAKEAALRFWEQL